MDKFRRNFSKVLEHFQSLLEPILSKVSHLGRFWTFLSRSEAFWGYIKCSGALFERFPGASRALDLAQVDLGRSGRPGRRWRATRALRGARPRPGRFRALRASKSTLARSSGAPRALRGARPRPGRFRADWTPRSMLARSSGAHGRSTSPRSALARTVGAPWALMGAHGR